jgi:hypothetical protein
MSMGRTKWAIAEGYIPATSHGPEPAMTSHETVCILNAGERDAHVAITVFYADRDPAGPYRVTVPARRTRHVRFNDLREPEPIPRDTDYASIVESDVPIRSWFSIRASIRVRRRTPSSPRWRSPQIDQRDRSAAGRPLRELGASRCAPSSTPTPRRSTSSPPSQPVIVAIPPPSAARAMASVGGSAG